MKNFLLVFAVLLSCYTASATHIIGGSLSYEHIGNGLYRIHLEVLRDCANGVPPFDDPATVSIYDENNELYLNLKIPVDASLEDTLTTFVPNNVCEFPQTICVHRMRYTTTALLRTLSDDNTYTMAYQRCCRSFTLANLLRPLSTGLTFHTTLIASKRNNSPQFKQDFPFAVFAATPFTYDASATDLDGDSLAYELIAPFIGGDSTMGGAFPDTAAAPPYEFAQYISPTYSVNNMLGGNYPLTIDAKTGQIVAIPPINGTYQVSYAVKEFRDGEEIGVTYREFTFNVIQQFSGQSYDVSGQVLIDGITPLDKGSVQILERNLANDSLSIYDQQMLGNDGSYAFSDIPAGIFYIKALIDTASAYYDDYLPTYFASDPFWYEADPLNQCDTSQFNRDIHLIPVDGFTGMHTLDGYVRLPGGGDPVADLDLLLADENGEPLQARRTNSEGYFKFENLEENNYLLMVDLINSAIDNSEAPQIQINEDNSILVTLNNDRLTIEESTAVSPDINKTSTTVTLYPNPASQSILLDISDALGGMYQATIYDTKGQAVQLALKATQLEQEGLKKVIHLDALPKGVYYLQLQSDQETIIKKFIKQ